MTDSAEAVLNDGTVIPLTISGSGPALLATDFLAIANAARADRFGYYGPRWGNVQVRIGAPLAEQESELTAAGWTVKVLPGLEHLGAMQGSAVVPLLKKWLDRVAA